MTTAIFIVIYARDKWWIDLNGKWLFAYDDADIAALDDPDKKLQVSQAELERQQSAYCEKNYHDALQRGDQDTALAAEGPLGPCRGSFLNLAKGKPAE